MTAQTTNRQTSCLVAGGAGFIGSYLCESLLKNNCRVICIDNFTSSTKQNIDRFLQHPHFQFINKDLSSPKAFENLYDPIDYIYHVAGIEAYVNGLNIDIDTLTVNSSGTRQLLDLAVRNNAKFLLGSTEFIHDYHYPGQDVSSYFGESRVEEGSHIFSEAKRFSESLTVEYASQRNVDARIVRLAFLYGPGMNLLSGNPLAKIFLSAIKTKQVLIPNDGLASLYPTYITDAIYGINKAMFSQSSNGKIFGLVQPNSITHLHLAYLIRDMLSINIEISFYKSHLQVNQTKITEEILKSQESLGWAPRVSIEDGLRNTFQWLEDSGIKVYQQIEQLETRSQASISTKPPEKKVITSTISPQSKTPVHKIQPSVVSTTIWQRLKTIHLPKQLPVNFKSPKSIAAIAISTSIILILIAPTIISIIFANQVINSLTASQQHFKNNQYQEFSNSISTSHTLLSIAETAHSIVETQRNLIRFPFPEQTQRQLRQSKQAIVILDSLQKVQHNLDLLADIVTGKEIQDPNSLLQEIKTNLQQANEHMAYLEAELSTSDNQVVVSLVTIRQHIKTAIDVSNILPDLLAFNDKKTLLIMLQDNQELRPSGGFLEAVGELTVEQGKLVDFQIFDVYSLDNLLKGDIKPPAEIETYLGESKWWLRDANFAPHFPDTAARVAWFYQKERGKTVDGVVAVNLNTFRTLLGSQEQLNIADVEEAITKNNIMNRAQHHAQVNFFEGNGQNQKSFLQNLAQAYYQKIINQQISYPQFALHLFKALENRDVSLWLPDTTSQKQIGQLGWDGGIRTTPNQLIEFGEINIRDFFASYDANFSVNKANYDIQKSINHQITLPQSGKLSIVSSITYKNNSKTQSWPSGTYKNYSRIYIPEKSRLLNVTVIENSDPNTEAKLLSSEINRTKDQNRDVVGFLVAIPPGESRTITMSYLLNEKTPTDLDQFNYSLYLQKQPGIEQTPTTITINHPQDIKVAKISPKATILPTALKFETLLAKDNVFAVSFLR